MQPDKPGWWQRNWKWAVPSGCLMVVMLFFASCVALMTTAVGMMKNTGAYEQALERVREHPGAIAALGEPIRAGWMLSGSVNENGDDGEADYTVPVSGPRGEGRLHIEATKTDGRWTFDRLTLVPDGGAPIDLRDAGERRARPEKELAPRDFERDSDGDSSQDDDAIPDVEQEAPDADAMPTDPGSDADGALPAVERDDADTTRT